MNWKKANKAQKKLLKERRKAKKKQIIEFKCLDSIDLQPYLTQELEIWDIMDNIAADYDDDFYEYYNFSIFDYINTKEFLKYLKKRYGNRLYFYEHIIYSVHLKKEN